MHDLILWPRVREYRPAMLHALLYEAPRGAFEDYFPNLCVLPLGDYPYFVRAMQARALHAEETAVAERLLRRMEAEGPLRTRAGGAQDGHAISGWGTRTTVAARVLEKLWRQGRLTIHRRENFERWFDLTERALPEAAGHHAPDAPLPTPDEEHAYKLRKRLRARRLFRRPRADDLAALGPGALVPLSVEGAARPWYALAEDAPALAAAESLSVVGDAVHLLAPLDPLVYDRERTRAVFGFDYTWEVYTPAAKRRWGYYVLPVLWGERLAGRVDPKLDRAARTLRLHSLMLEPWADAERIAPALAARLADLARFLGAENIHLGRVEPEAARGALAGALAGVC
jgi:uncharacterized protein YcaQ